MVDAMSDLDVTQADRYAEAAARYAAKRQRQAQWSRRLSYARLIVVLAAAASILSAFPGPVSHAALRIGAGLAGFIGFFGLVYWHSRVEAGERWFATLAQVNTEAAARVRRDWDALTPSPATGPGPGHAYADDLDVFGHASVFQLLGWVGTDAGRATLSEWLTTAAAPETIRDRQQAVAELAPLEHEREEFAALGRIVEPARHALDGLYEWAEAGPWFVRRPWAPWAVRLLAGLLLGLLGAHIGGVIDRPLWVYPLAGSVVLMVILGKRTARTFTLVFSRYSLLQHHADLFARMANTPFSSPRLRRLQADLMESGMTASREMARLSAIGQFADLRLVVLFHPVITLLTLWDFHVLIELERWQARTAPHLRRWFAALGEFDALAALAALEHDNPDWAFPEIVESARLVEARQLGHPLIAADRRVPNDVTVGPPGSFLMVTGSNMSGKSTLLRAIGVNVVLAQAGAPVCAERLTMPPLALCTSMRVEDSLEEGVSYFMAALQRLKMVVSAARAVRPGDPMLLYLLDEVLQGTNTAERQVAVRRILHHLMALRAIGAVTTHDLELAACPELAANCQAVHFSEGVEHHDQGLRLSFDYRLKPGIATSRNALKLLQIVGLDS
jgi:ABC-type multidrug transport system fused ATPase/permease subunit